VRIKGGDDRRVSIHSSLLHRALVSSLYSPSQNVSCFNLVQTPPWWIACSINLDCFFKLFLSSPLPCVNKLSNPLISAGTRYHLTSLLLPLLLYYHPFFLPTTPYFELSTPSFYAVPAMKLINLVFAVNIRNRRSVIDIRYDYALCTLFVYYTIWYNNNDASNLSGSFCVIKCNHMVFIFIYCCTACRLNSHFSMSCSHNCWKFELTF